MELHHQLQALVRQRGEAVLADPDALRAALEDYLDEQTASTGDLNLLVDAVRLGGLARLRSASDGGALPAAAVEAAGDYLARQRGSSDVTSAQWACAALGYALGVVPDQVPTALRRTLGSGGAAGFPPAGPPVTSPAPMVSPQMSPVQQPWQSGPAVGGQPGWSPVAPGYGQQPPKRSKAPLIAVGAVVALLAAGGGIAWAVTAGDGDDNDAGEKATTSETSSPDGSDSTDSDSTDSGLLADMSPEEISAAIVEDMSAVNSLNMAGQMESDGERMRLDLSFDTEGKCTGSIILMEGGSASFISDGKDEYLRGDEAFWIASSDGEAPQYVLDMFVGKWLKTPGTGNFASFCDLNNLLEEFDNDGATDFEVGSTTVVNGRDALELVADDGTSIYASNSGPHHILRMVNEGEEPGEFLFSKFDEPVDVEAPTDYIDNPGA